MDRHPSKAPVRMRAAPARPDRRRFLKAAVSAGVALGAPAVHADHPTALRHLDIAYSDGRAILARAEADLGIHVHRTVMDPDAMLRALITNPNAYDVVTVDMTIARQLHRLGRLRPLDARRLRHADGLHRVFTSGIVDGVAVSRQGDAPMRTIHARGPESREFAPGPTGWLVVMPTVFNADTLGVRPDLAARAVTSWGDVLDEDFHGRAATTRIASIAILDMALAAEARGRVRYADKGNMTREEIDRTLALLGELQARGHFQPFWRTFQESVALMRSGAVHVQSMWAPGVHALREQGVACAYPGLAEGYRGWSSGLAIPMGLSGRELDLAYRYIDWACAGWYGAHFMRYGYYPSVPDTARGHMSPAEWDYWVEGRRAAEAIPGPGAAPIAPPGAVRDGGSMNARVSAIACWNSLMDEARYLLSGWRRLLDG